MSPMRSLAVSSPYSVSGQDTLTVRIMRPVIVLAAPSPPPQAAEITVAEEDEAPEESGVRYNVRQPEFEFTGHLLPTLLRRDDLPESYEFASALNKLIAVPASWLNAFLFRPDAIGHCIARKTGTRFTNATVSPVLGTQIVRAAGDKTRPMHPAHAIEMFRQGADLVVHLPRRADPQLISRLRMIWWLENADGGFDMATARFHGHEGILANVVEAVLPGAGLRPTLAVIDELPTPG